MEGADSTGLELMRLYDGLSRWARWWNRLGWGSRSASLSMHKVVKPSVDDLAFDAANLPPAPRVLDAGCGLGGTVFRWHEKVGGTYEGITLSPVQVEMANREARHRGITSQVRFDCAGYDEPVTGTYDAVVAIESLIHSRHFSRTIGHLSGALRSGGRLVMVDDVMTDDGEPVPSPGVERLKRLWHLRGIPSEGAVRTAFTSSRLNLIEETDLTGRIQWSHPRYLSLADGLLNIAHRALPLGWVREVGRAYRGGVALRRLYGEGKMRYKLFVGEKQ